MSAAEMESFEPATMPLDGVRLVEASAGTGKTFSLAGLYLRLIVERGLDVREVLVMTFTRAATQELRERLRGRLAQAARIASEPARDRRADAAEHFAESVIRAAGDHRPAVAERLRDAATRVDQATITTIHGFAQRAAADNAFDSALPFDRGQSADDRDIEREAATDYWRSRVFGDRNARARAFLTLWPTPQALQEAVREILAKPHARLVVPATDRVARDRDTAQSLWPALRPQLVALLRRALDDNALYAGSKLQALLEAGGVEEFAAMIDAGLAGTADGCPAVPAMVTALADDAGVAGHAKKAARTWFRPQDLAGVAELARLAVDGRVLATARAVDDIGTRAAARKHERRLFSFKDLITGLHGAMTDATGGPRLAAALRRTWPWALVDESQDTDPLQYEILRRIYGRAEAAGGAAGGGLILIGDPKQAIYGFRGGDVFTYLAAARDADGRYGMDTNFRSTPAVVDGLNALFGAGGADAFVLDGIRLARVRAHRTRGDRRIHMDGDELPGVTAWTIPDDAGPAKNSLAPRIERATVARVADLLARGRVEGEATDRRLRPSDVAVLVNSNREAASMQEALRRAGVPAICIQQDSVFGRDAAQDLLRVLQAAAAPLDPDRLRVALITPVFGLRLADLVALDADDQQWTGWAERFQQLHATWAQTGVQAMLEPVLQDAAPRIAALADGERRLTDYLHVAERLQEAEHEAFGLDGLVAWLADAIRTAGEGEATDADRVRIADDAELVQVTTVHKAKGLQFPVVFVPYSPWLGTGGNRPDTPPLEFHDDDGRAVIDPGAIQGGEQAAAAVRERRAEQVRSLYVALTRAQQACFLVHGPANGSGDGPLTWLLHRDDGAGMTDWHGGGRIPDWFDADRATRRLAEVAADSHGGLVVEPLPDPDAVAASVSQDHRHAIGPARTDLPQRRRPWGVFSFSGIAGALGDGPAMPTEPAAGADDPDSLSPASIDDADTEHEIPLTPRGAGFGRAVHDLLEAHPFTAWPAAGSAPDEEQRGRIAATLRRHGVAATQGPDGSIERTAAMLTATVHTPLPDIGPLAAIAPARQCAEMEFFIRLGGTPANALLDRIAAAGYRGAAGQAAPAALRGLMHGYIDLVVEHDGAYWLLDYKTNALGPHRADYRPERLAAAIADHHYDLQYLIYSVALHRHLRRRLPGYDPGRHLGGVHYLFVRALDGDRGVFRDRPRTDLIVELDALLDGAETGA